MGFISPPSSEMASVAAHQVFDKRHGFQMIRVDAPSVAAKMVNVQSGWDWPLVELVSESVRTVH
jgi:hypothetical protein